MPKPIRIAIVDDDPMICDLFKQIFNSKDYSIHITRNKKDLLSLLEKEYIDIILQDIFLKDENGIDILKEVRKKYPSTEFIMMTGNGTIDTAVQAMKSGACDFITKPFKNDEIITRVEKAYEKSLLENENQRLKSELQRPALFPEIIGSSTELKNLLKTIEKIAPKDASVLIQGESGTGKELLARSIHRLSHRKEKPFIAINCSNLEKQLLESELFGYVKGAFTGAGKSKPGLIECADEGTLFIDEIGDMDLSVQPKLLRFLETQEFRRLGDNRIIKVNVRVVAASHKNIKEEISKKNFREDLFYRLNVVDLHVPELRKRKEDIPLLARYFLQKGLAPKERKTISQDAIKMLLQYDFPGNIRELKNIIERASILSSATTITPEDLPMDIQNNIRGKSSDKKKLDEFLSQEEKNFLQQTLNECHGNKTLAAKVLGISRRNLYRKLEQYQL